MCQKCVNLMESIYWSQMKTRAYRTHCHDITLIVSKLWPTLVETLQERNPNLCDVAGAEQEGIRWSKSRIGELIDDSEKVLRDETI